MFLAYRILTTLLFPFFVAFIYLRKFTGKEDGKSCKEKIFAIPLIKKKDEIQKKLIWFHAASIGEVTSIIPLLKKLETVNKEFIFLITTVTLSSGRIIENELVNNENIFHQYFPLDTYHLVEKFLNLWKPELAIFVDSEIWPNFIFQINKKKIPLVLANARITKKTLQRWKFLNFFSKHIFSCFDLCLSSSKDSENNLKILGANKILFYGNLKFTIKNKLLGVKEENKNILDSKKVWLASSTHRGEELICLKTHNLLKKNYSNAITIIAPRHISRVKEIKKLSDKMKLKCQILNEDDLIDNEAEILIINSFGILSKYFNYCKSVFIGKSMIKKLISVGGQNPIEAAKFGCRIYHGPYIYNFKEVYEYLAQYNISKKIQNSYDLFMCLDADFTNNIAKNNLKSIEEFGGKILDKSTKAITQLIK